MKLFLFINYLRFIKNFLINNKKKFNCLKLKKIIFSRFNSVIKFN